MKAVGFLSQVLDSPEQEAVRDAVRNLQDIGEGFLNFILIVPPSLCRLS